MGWVGASWKKLENLIEVGGIDNAANSNQGLFLLDNLLDCQTAARNFLDMIMQIANFSVKVLAIF